MSSIENGVDFNADEPRSILFQLHSSHLLSQKYFENVFVLFSISFFLEFFILNFFLLGNCHNQY